MDLRMDGTHCTYDDTISRILRDEGALKRLGLTKYDIVEYKNTYGESNTKYDIVEFKKNYNCEELGDNCEESSENCQKTTIQTKMQKFKNTLVGRWHRKHKTEVTKPVKNRTNSLDRASFLL